MGNSNKNNSNKTTASHHVSDSQNVLLDSPETKIKMQTVLFDYQIKRNELTAFRGAIAFKAGLQYDTFHNHKNITGSSAEFHHRYPMIQYQSHGRKAAIVAFGQGVEDLKQFMEQYDGRLNLNGKMTPVPVLANISKAATIKASENFHDYTLTHWIALNQENYPKWRKAFSIIQRAQILEDVLENHIVSLCKGVEWRPTIHFKAHITDIQERHVKYRNQRYRAFNIRYKTNLILPPYLGLGKAVSEGFGMNTKLDV